MATKTQLFSLPKAPPAPPNLRIGPFTGIDLSTNQAQINQNSSPDMLNFSIDERGSLNKRTGYERIFSDSLGVGQINGMHEYRKVDDTVLFLLAHGTKLYSQSGSDQPVEIYSGLNNDPVDFFTLNGNCYLLDGANYLQFDGSACTTVIPYIPTLSISGDPAGGGTPYEDWNLLGTGFKDSKSADGIATDYQLSLAGLDETAVTAVVNNVEMVEGTDFTVDRILGKITFTIAPTTGTNNVIITAYKTQPTFPDRIKKCTFHVLFGGANDTRVFVSGNPDFSNMIWRSGLYDPTYFPENGFYKIGNDSEAVTGFAKQYDYLVIEKENSKGNMQYQLDVNGMATFPIKPINDQIGTLARKSIQVIDNNPVSLSKSGVYMLVQSNVRDERNTKHISLNVDKKLLKEPNLKNAISIDYQCKYWLAINGNVYVYDYTLNEWYIYDNINASCFLERDGVLYFGSSTDGIVYRFKDETHLLPYEDDGQAINAYWVSKLLDFGKSEYMKIVQRVFVNIRPDIHTSLNLYARSDRKGETFILTTRMDQFNLNYLNLNKFSLITSDIPQEAAKKVKMKKITHFQLKIENNELEESLGIVEIAIKFSYQSEKRK